MENWKQCNNLNSKTSMQVFLFSMLEYERNKIQSNQNKYILSLLGVLSLYLASFINIYIKKIDINCYKIILLLDLNLFEESIDYLLKTDDFNILKINKKDKLSCSFYYYKWKKNEKNMY